MSEDTAREIAERLFTTSSGVRAEKIIQADSNSAPIDELDFETVVRLIEETLGE
jgi:hypothetical protein